MPRVACFMNYDSGENGFAFENLITSCVCDWKYFLMKNLDLTVNLL